MFNTVWNATKSKYKARNVWLKAESTKKGGKKYTEQKIVLYFALT